MDLVELVDMIPDRQDRNADVKNTAPALREMSEQNASFNTQDNDIKGFQLMGGRIRNQSISINSPVNHFNKKSSEVSFEPDNSKIVAESSSKKSDEAEEGVNDEDGL